MPRPPNRRPRNFSYPTYPISFLGHGPRSPRPTRSHCSRSRRRRKKHPQVIPRVPGISASPTAGLSFFLRVRSTCNPRHRTLPRPVRPLSVRPRTFGVSRRPRSKARRHRCRFFYQRAAPFLPQDLHRSRKQRRHRGAHTHIVPRNRCSLSHYRFSPPPLSFPFLFLPSRRARRVE